MMAPIRAGKADGFGGQTVNLFPSGEWIEPTPAHHALLVQWQDTRPISAETWFDSKAKHHFTDRSPAGAGSGLLTRYLDGFDPLPVLQCTCRHLVMSPACRAGSGGFDPRHVRHIVPAAGRGAWIPNPGRGCSIHLRDTIPGVG